MRVEIVAVGTELLLGQIADTNSAWLGDRLAAAGVVSHFHQAVGDNHERIVLAFRTALARSDGIIVCGGLGPTQDDITREAIADVMGVELVRDQEIVEVIAGFFQARGRTMSANNDRQADVPVGATIIPQRVGTAPGLICPLGNKVIYAVPGVPYEMAEMFERGILPDLRARMAEAGEEGVIVSRVLRTWGASESGLAESLQGRIDALDADDADDAGVPAGVGHLGLPGLGHRGDQGADHRARRHAVRGHRAARSRGEGRAGGHRGATGRHRVRRGRRVHGGRRGRPVDRPRPHAGRGRVAHRRADRLTPGQRPRRVDLVPRGRRGLSRAGEVRRAWTCPSARWSPRRRPPPWPKGCAGSPAPTSDSASPAWPDPTTRRGWPRGPSSWGCSLPDGTVSTRELHVPGDRERVRQYGAISALDLLRRALIDLGA